MEVPICQRRPSVPAILDDMVTVGLDTSVTTPGAIAGTEPPGKVVYAGADGK